MKELKDELNEERSKRMKLQVSGVLNSCKNILDQNAILLLLNI